MSLFLQTDITTWRGDYDQTGINNYNSSYIGSILDVNGNYHTGTGIYDPNAVAPTYEIYDFCCYAGQGVDHNTPINGGGKFLVQSDAGFSWDTTYDPETELYTFVTSGSLDSLYLGYTPSGDYGAAPASATLTTFDADKSLLVVTGFDIAVDAVAANVFSVADGNAAISVSGTFASILANAPLYEEATLNSAVLYGLAFDNTATQAFEFVLDQYLQSLDADVSLASSYADIATALANTGVSITYYDYADDYAVGGVIPCGCAETEVASDTLLAA